ncbi:MAG: extracellular solute-binding protein [Chloroflexi bacterium]|jgi:multiple sugar transport system substrate-binding protein|nr:extracellular solute-binding protein [Anaerolineaceae bacterium]NMB88280.1 extracellular solute-binding protein [Chloroflexota bacterium]
MKKRMSALFALGMIAVLALSACAPAATPTPAPEGSGAGTQEDAPGEAAAPASDAVVEITFWHTYNEEGAENDMLVKTLIPIFEEAHPDIKVNAVSVPYDNFREKLLAAISANTAPDLIRTDIIWVPELAEVGALAALDEVMPDFEDYRSNVFEGPLSTNFWKDHYYGLPLDTNTKVWLYNDALYQEAGLDGPPATLAELETACQAIQEVNPEASLFAADGMYSWVTLPWVWSFGGDITDEGITTASGYINSPKAVAAYEYLLQLYDEGCIAPVIMGDGVDPYAGFAAGTYASMDNGPWAYSILNGQYPDFEFSAALFPAGEAGSIEIVGGEDINLTQQSQHPQEAMEFIRYLLSQDYQLKMMEVGQMPVRADLADSDAVKNHPFLGTFFEQIATSKARTAHPSWNQMDTILTDAGQYIFRGEKTPQQALDDAAAQIDELLQP